MVKLKPKPNVFANAITMTVATCLCLAGLELAFRLIDGYRIDQLRLALREGLNTEPAEASLHYAKQRILDPSFDISWYSTNLADYDRSPKFPVPADWKAAVEHYHPSPGERAFVAEELKFLYNYNWLVETCKTGDHANVIKYYKRSPGFVYGFRSPDASTDPPYRILPRGWSRGQDYYNNFGFRGPDISPHLWAKAQKLDVDFDVINAGRGGTDSRILAKVMRFEVAPLHPDIVVYYEGANDLHAKSVVKVPKVIAGHQPGPAALRAFMNLRYLPFEETSALMDRIYELLFRRGGLSAEPPKPPHKLTFDISQTDPDISRQDLPFRLHDQVADLRYIADAAKDVDASFFLTSFITLTHDGLLLDPERHRIILQGLNGEYFPMTYAEIREAVDFQNRVFLKLAHTDHVPFLDVNRHFPQDPDFFADMVHFSSSGGFRLQGWIVAQHLAPYIANRDAKRKAAKAGLRRRSKGDRLGDGTADQV